MKRNPWFSADIFDFVIMKVYLSRGVGKHILRNTLLS